MTSLKVDGGMTNSDVFVQIQADILGVAVMRPSMRETTALGAALAAGLAVGVWSSVDQLQSMASAAMTTFQPENGMYIRFVFCLMYVDAVYETFETWKCVIEHVKQWPIKKQK